MTHAARWVLTAWSAGSMVCDVATWRSSFQSYLSAYPRAEAQDVYKLAHQGILGSEHAVKDTAMVNTWMRRELGELPARPAPTKQAAPLIEPLPPDGRYVRVHLRPFVQAKGDVPLLLRAFVATANGARGDTAQFACAERALRSLATQRLPDQTIVNRTLTLFATQRRVGFAALHHSAAFEDEYAPAYRVVASEWTRAVEASASKRR